MREEKRCQIGIAVYKSTEEIQLREVHSVSRVYIPETQKVLSKYLPSDLLEFLKVIPMLSKFPEHSCTSKVSRRVSMLPELQKLFILSEVAYLAITYCRSLQVCLCPSHKLSFFFSFLSHSSPSWTVAEVSFSYYLFYFVFNECSGHYCPLFT